MKIHPALPALVVALGAIATLVRASKYPINQGEPIAIGALSILTLVLFYAGRRGLQSLRPRHAAVHYILSLLSVTCFSTVSFLETAFSDMTFFPLVAGMLFLAATAVSFLIAVPKAILPYRQLPKSTVTLDHQLDAGAALSSRLEAMRGAFDAFQSAMASGRSALDEALGELQRQLAAQSLELRNAELKLASARSEAEHYRKVANLSKEDQALFLELLSKGKRSDYWIGFLLGVASSVVATLLTLFVQRLLGGA